MISRIDMPSRSLQVAQQLEDLRLDRHVERGRRLVGDQQLRVARERHRDHHALAHAARELVRVVVERAARPRGCRRARASRSRAPQRLLAARRPGAARTASAICSPTGEDRVQRGHRLLEDHRDLVAADLLAARARDSSVSSRPSKTILLPGSIRPRLVEQAHDRERGDATCRCPTRRRRRASRPRVELEVDAVDGADQPASVENEVRRSETRSSGSVTGAVSVPASSR